MTVARAGVERLDELEPLWAALQRHHADVAPEVMGAPARPVDEAWMHRRGAYLEWLTSGAAFAFVAEEGGRAVGYVFVRVAPGWAAWDTGERIGVVETLAVLPEERGRGIGSRLLDSAEGHLGEIGVSFYEVSSVAGNEEAISFYERRGLERCRVSFAGRVSAPEEET